MGTDQYAKLEAHLALEPFVFSGAVDSVFNVEVLVDTRCNVMAVIDSRFVNRSRLGRISIPPRDLNAYDDKPNGRVDQLVHVKVDLGGIDSDVWMYEVKKLD